MSSPTKPNSTTQRCCDELFFGRGDGRELDPRKRDAVLNPDNDELASVLAAIIASAKPPEQIRDSTGLPWETVMAAIQELRGREMIRDIFGHQLTHQRLCAGSCMRDGHYLRGHAVVFAPESMRWFCEECWKAEAEHVQGLVEEREVLERPANT